LGPNNQYEAAIGSVGEIICCYDSDQKFPVFGFGGITNETEGKVSHCFPINGNSSDPNVQGLNGIISAYK